MSHHKTYRITIHGLVQGVGFRPFIYKLALNHKLKGTVENRNDGVIIEVVCIEDALLLFIENIKKNAPPASNISTIRYEVIENKSFDDFSIIQSSSVSENITDVSPDIAVCDDCLEDMKNQPNRHDYPFINCTNCGPRFTIIEDLPYDREKTSMKEFTMCPDCYKEYSDVFDRRFHAQPTACSICGPHYTLHSGDTDITEPSQVISRLAAMITDGKIVAVKGLGGFFLACDAFSEEAVLRLRQLKNREGKPFAVMFSAMQTLKEFAELSEEEEKSLNSLKRPIVLLKQKQALAYSVTVGFDTIGVMLPYMPLHYLLFEKLGTCAIVLTSGNLSDEPILIDNDKALITFTGIADAVLTYNRDIHNRADDSLVTIVNKTERVIRRSRGYAPSAIRLNTEADGILATGAELVNCFCIGKGKQALLSQHIGDLKNFETYEFYTETIEKYKKLFRFEPRLIVSDMHPTYLSTRYAAETGLPHLKVQHHHAHIASVMALHNVSDKVIGVCFDGTGYGDDGHIWGSEFLFCDNKGYERINHFEYIPMPGGDKATEEPWRMAVSYLYHYFGRDFLNFHLPFIKTVGEEKVEFILQAIDKKINTPLSCSAGRLFDAVAAFLNICTVSKFHAEAPMRLESYTLNAIKESYTFSTSPHISFRNTFKEIFADMKKHVDIRVIAAKFHNTIIEVILNTANTMRDQSGVNKIILSGGSFQNKYITSRIENVLKSNTFDVLPSNDVPVNDAGVALGQLFIASHIHDKVE